MKAKRIVVFFLLAGLLAPIAAAGAQEDQGWLVGTLLDPEGNPAKNFQLIFRQDSGDVEFISSPSDKKGNYSIELPAGSNYLLVGALTPDGKRIDVPPLPPIPVVAGERRLDLRFSSVNGKRRGGAAVGNVPWWQLGLAAGGVILLTTSVLDGDTPQQTASPFMP